MGGRGAPIERSEAHRITMIIITLKCVILFFTISSLRHERAVVCKSRATCSVPRGMELLSLTEFKSHLLLASLLGEAINH